jgi:hypothetical protein
MKKSKILLVGLIGLLLAIGLVLSGCAVNCPAGGTCDVARDSTGYAYRDYSCSNHDCRANNVSSGSTGSCNCTS